ncbi:MAG: hypothetical protein JWN38_66 [Candidatus Saccharibacteria bacterium]|nr:hypothetical protein [Candidatus Saccharibacteria bacterium]
MSSLKATQALQERVVTLSGVGTLVGFIAGVFSVVIPIFSLWTGHTVHFVLACCLLVAGTMFTSGTAYRVSLGNQNNGMSARTSRIIGMFLLIVCLVQFAYASFG